MPPDSTILRLAVARLDHRRHRRPRLRPRRPLRPRRRRRRHRLARRRRAPRRPPARAGALVPGGELHGGSRTPRRPRAAEIVVLCVPVPQPVRDAHEPQGAPARGPARGRRDRAAGRRRLAARRRALLGVWQGSAAQQAAGDGPRRRARRLPRCTRSAPRCSRDLDARARRGRAGLRRPQGRQAPSSRELIDRIDGLRGVDCGPPGDGAHRRGAHAAADLDQRPRTRRTPGIKITGPVTARSSSWPAAPAAPSSRAGMLDVVGDDLVVDRQHRRRRRDLRRARLPRPRPRHLLAGRPHRRARLGPATATRSHVMDALRELGRRRLVQPRRPRPRDRPAPGAAAGARARADGGAAPSCAARSACARACCR